MNLKMLFFPFSIVVSLVVFIWYAKPEWEEYRAKNVELVQLKEQQATIKNNKANIEKAKLAMENEPREIKDLVYNILPTKKNEDDLVAEINKNAVVSNVVIEKIGIGKSEGNSSGTGIGCEADLSGEDGSFSSYCPPLVMESLLKFSVRGNYLNIKNFIGLLDAQNRMLLPFEMSFSKNESTDEEGNSVEGDNLAVNFSFHFFDREDGAGLKMSNLSLADSVFESLISGGLDTTTINDFKKVVSSDYFVPVSFEGAGKANPFLK